MAGNSSEEEAAWRDLVAQYGSAPGTDGAPVPWPAREDLPAPGGGRPALASPRSTGERPTGERAGDERPPQAAPGGSDSGGGPASGGFEGEGDNGGSHREGPDLEDLDREGHDGEGHDDTFEGKGSGDWSPGAGNPGGGNPGAGNPGGEGHRNEGPGNGGPGDAGTAGVNPGGEAGGGPHSAAGRPAPPASPLPGIMPAPPQVRIVRPAAPVPYPGNTGPASTGPASDDGDGDDEFVPPVPPPLPRLDPVSKGAWAALFGGPGYLMIAVVLGWPVPGWAAFCSVAAFVGGFTTLVMRMGERPPRDSGPDDGAVV